MKHTIEGLKALIMQFGTRPEVYDYVAELEKELREDLENDAYIRICDYAKQILGISETEES